VVFLKYQPFGKIRALLTYVFQYQVVDFKKYYLGSPVEILRILHLHPQTFFVDLKPFPVERISASVIFASVLLILGTPQEDHHKKSQAIIYGICF
jgi:hypothetical protein